MGKGRYWLKNNGAIERPGRVKAYLRRKYGGRAFTERGTIKVEYLNKAIRSIGKTRAGSSEHGLKMALVLAKRLKKGL